MDVICGFANRVLFGANIQIDEGLYALVIKKINGLGIMRSVDEKHFIDRAQGETLLEFNRAHNQTDAGKQDAV